MRSCFGKSDPLLTQRVQVLLLARSDNSGLQPAFADAIASTVASHLLEHCRAPDSAPRPAAALSAWQLRRVQALVRDNLDQPLTTALLAAEVELSVFDFSRRCGQGF